VTPDYVAEAPLKKSCTGYIAADYFLILINEGYTVAYGVKGGLPFKAGMHQLALQIKTPGHAPDLCHHQFKLLGVLLCVRFLLVGNPHNSHNPVAGIEYRYGEEPAKVYMPFRIPFFKWIVCSEVIEHYPPALSYSLSPDAGLFKVVQALWVCHCTCRHNPL